MNNFSKNIDINIKLNNIFKNRFDIDLFNDGVDIDVNDNFFGKKFRLKARDIIYLLYDVEKEFNIIITENDINDIEFNTINNVIKIIDNKLHRKEKEVI